MEKSNKTEKDKISEALDNFANSSIKILNEALAGKDAIIRDLREQIKNCKCKGNK